MRTALTTLLAISIFAFGCSSKEPEIKKPPLRYKVESQRAAPYVVTIWSTSPSVSVGSNAFKLQFQTPEKQPADPGEFQVEPVLVETGKSPIPGTTRIKPTEEPGVYDVAAELPTPGRWRFNVAVGSHNLAFYYSVTQERPSLRGADADETKRSR